MEEVEGTHGKEVTVSATLCLEIEPGANLNNEIYKRPFFCSVASGPRDMWQISSEGSCRSATAFESI